MTVAIRVFKTDRLSKTIRGLTGNYSGWPISLDLQDTDLDKALRILEVAKKKYPSVPNRSRAGSSSCPCWTFSGD